MNEKLIAPLTGKFAGRPQTPLDHRLASALRRLHSRLRPSACSVYLLTEDGRELAAAMIVATPLSFTMIARAAADDLHFPASRAFQTGELVLFERADLQNLARRFPAVLAATAYPMLIAAVPVRTARHRFGAVGLRWAPPREVSRQELEYLRTVADELACEVERLVEQGVSVEAPFVPLFIPESSAPSHDALQPVPAPDAAPHQREEPPGGPPAEITHLYRLQKLTSDLSAAVGTRDVVGTAQTHLVRPFGGRGLMLCLAQNERLHVVGAAGFSREAIHRVEGTLLARHAPETDTVTGVEIQFFSTLEEVRQAYPNFDHDPEYQARAYMPLISNGRVVGCCVLEFAESGRVLAADERAILMLMLEQVGQSLERARSCDVEQALTQTMQRSLLPRSLLHQSEVVTTARYLPATEGAEVGGDWYDTPALPDGRIGLVIGDVEGHSLGAVGLMGQLRSAVRAYAAEGHEPASVLERSNRLLAELDTDLYATCCCMWLDVATGIASVATAGHPVPLISDVQGRITSARLPVGPPLGIDAGAHYQQEEIQMYQGSVAALFTDGLLDARRLGADAAAERLARVLAEYCGENLEVLADRLVGDRLPRLAPVDDAALLLLRYEGAQPESRPQVARTSIPRHDLQGVARIRRFIAGLFAEWRLLYLRDDVELMTCEVVTNALIHAHSEVDLRLRQYPDRVRVEVRDSDPYPPVPTAVLSLDQANQEAESGRGLLIVDALATAWGSSPSGRGKTTWFEIRVPENPDPLGDRR
ncbi:SpoIIE family protein phosphatase [Streptomyces sp. NPDC056669]|uniref:SpoIIE family protein phosphatase n=1 Tax=Streptomyces sp. NPDC056669 TaxID=3345903 RepID=UPI0036BE6614